MTDDITVMADGGDEPTHRVVGKGWRYGDTQYEAGDLVAPPESALRVHAPKFEPLGEDVDVPAPEPDGDESDDPVDEAEADEAEAPFDPGEYTIGGLEDALADVESAAELEALRDAEAGGDDRAGAVDAIDARLAEVNE